MPESLSREQIEVILKRFKHVTAMHIDTEGLKNYSFEAEQDFDTDWIILKLFHRPFGEIITEIKYPANWKEAIKEAFQDWMGRRYTGLYCWLTKRYPVKHKRYDVTVFYPRISLPDEENVVGFMPQRGK
jgi:hypothetical protein